MKLLPLTNDIWTQLGIPLCIVALLASGCYGHSCYVCKSGDPCDDVTESMKTNCKSPLGAINTCIKAKVSANTIRACGVPGTNIIECKYDSGVSVCMCTTDLCNGAGPQRHTPLVNILLPMTVTLCTLLPRIFS
ncbi:hypothetical protein RvY_03337 [Ramazzottius varieornatus]|uniref:Protein quiver n=1 Tax=Ramazzottius varieornatus TaxID=947166 RepID=A0A1D1UMP2_RAMVA|nr:hypothetical protein RvY_03337 [Ramazzottius varieornatus]